MEVLRSNVNPRSDAYQGNRTAFLEQLAYLEEQLALTREGGGPKYVERHRQRGKLMARERIELLLDPRLAVPRDRAARRPGARSSASAAASSPASAWCRASSA